MLGVLPREPPSCVPECMRAGGASSTGAPLMRYQGDACGGQAINRTPLTSDRLSNKIFPGALLSPLVGEGAKEIFFGVLTTLPKKD